MHFQTKGTRVSYNLTAEKRSEGEGHYPTSSVR
jgi:hypothetical protein